MGTYWDEFILEYKDYLSITPLNEILQAFWCSCNDKNDRCKEIMEKPVKEFTPTKDETLAMLGY